MHLIQMDHTSLESVRDAAATIIADFFYGVEHAYLQRRRNVSPQSRGDRRRVRSAVSDESRVSFPRL
ncbi:hypothetical protein BJX62DRAFT_215037 [Aspergillus germanicus]